LTTLTGADLVTLALHFLAQLAEMYGCAVRGFSEGARRLLRSYDWPGNVRELQNAMERAAVMAKGEQIEPRDQPPQLAESRPRVGPVGAALANLPFAGARDQGRWTRGRNASGGGAGAARR
jgi:DNA-binding NtrC family response regulator